jgi:hypothetical protein
MRQFVELLIRFNLITVSLSFSSDLWNYFHTQEIGNTRRDSLQQ